MGHIGTKLGQKYDKFDEFYINYRQSKIICQELEWLIYWGFEWSGQRGSNPRHQAWEACTLPTELCPLI